MEGYLRFQSESSIAHQQTRFRLVKSNSIQKGRMVGIESSCNPKKLKKVIWSSKMTMSGYYGLTPEDKEEILLEVMYRFELDGGKFPYTLYGVRYCRNKIQDLVVHKHALKRCNQKKFPNGKKLYFYDLSLNMSMDGRDGQEDEMLLEDTIEDTKSSLFEVEFLADVERSAPELLPLARRALAGERLNSKEKNILRDFIK